MDSFINFENTESGTQVHFIDSRYYKLGDKWLPGISTILDVVNKGKEFDKWLKSNGFNADILAREAMTRGSNVHEAIERLLKGEELLFGTIENGAYYSRHEWEMISRFIDFYENFHPEIISVEKVLVSEKLGFGSQLDLVCKLNGSNYIIDYKTGNLYDSALLQLSAYKELWNEYFPQILIEKCAILHLESTHRGRDKSGKEIQGKGWKLVEVEETEKHYEDFKHIQAIWRRKNPNYAPFNVTYPSSYNLNIKNS